MSKSLVPQSEDSWEREADRVADQVMNTFGSSDTPLVTSTSQQRLQRSCTQCETESASLDSKDDEEASETETSDSTLVQRRSEPSTAGGVPETGGLNGAGQPLPEPARAFFESRFGHDFSHVRIHADESAARMSRALNAQAFTLGRDIAFSAGAYSPDTRAGRGLLAHELAHVLQQQRAPVRIQRKESTSIYEEHASGITTHKKSGLVTGEVDRREYEPAKGGGKGKRIHSSTVKLSFDPSNCALTIPVKLAFEHPTSSNWPAHSCEHVQTKTRPVPKPLDTSTFGTVANEYLSVVNKHLNNWFVARMGCKKEHDCADKDIPIKVDAQRDDSNPDVTVIIANLPGRACVTGGGKWTTIYVPKGKVTSSVRRTMAHEGGHFALGHGDEYSEEGESESRVREDDFSLMASHHDYRDWALLHKRHFAFVPEFLSSAFTDSECSVELKEISRPLVVDFRAPIVVTSLGYARFGGEDGSFLQTGFDFGIPLDRLRRWEANLGARATWMTQLGGDYRNAFMFGARLGMRYATSASGHGFLVEPFGEFGGGRFDVRAPEGRVPDAIRRTEPAWRPYAEGGVRLGYSSPATGGAVFEAGAEVAGGSTIKIDVTDEQLPWVRLGIGAAILW